MDSRRQRRYKIVDLVWEDRPRVENDFAIAHPAHYRRIAQA